MVAQVPVRVKVVEPLWIGTAILDQTKSVNYDAEEINRQPNLKVVKWINETYVYPSIASYIQCGVCMTLTLAVALIIDKLFPATR